MWYNLCSNLGRGSYSSEDTDLVNHYIVLRANGYKFQVCPETMQCQIYISQMERLLEALAPYLNGAAIELWPVSSLNEYPTVAIPRLDSQCTERS